MIVVKYHSWKQKNLLHSSLASYILVRLFKLDSGLYRSKNAHILDCFLKQIP